MALRSSFEFAGLTVADGYLRVIEVSGTKNSVGFGLAYLNGTDGPLVKTERFSFTPNMQGDNFIRQAYLYLKTLPDFADAEDV